SNKSRGQAPRLFPCAAVIRWIRVKCFSGSVEFRLCDRALRGRFITAPGQATYCICFAPVGAAVTVPGQKLSHHNCVRQTVGNRGKIDPSPTTESSILFSIRYAPTEVRTG